MNKENQRMLNWLNRLTDMIAIYLAYVLAVIFWLNLPDHDRANISYRLATEHPGLILILIFGYIIIFQYGGLYDSIQLHLSLRKLRRIFACYTAAVAADVGLLFLCGEDYFSRGVMVCFLLLGYVLLILKHILFGKLVTALRKKGISRKKVLIAGDGVLAEKYVAELRNEPDYGIICTGYCGRRMNTALGTYLGTFSDFAEILEQNDPDEVIIALDQYEQKVINFLIRTCEAQGIKASIIPIYSDYLPASATIEPFGDVRMISVRSAPLDLWLNKAIKRIFDIVFSLAVIIILSPLLAVIAIGVRLSGPGPVLFKQTRVGLNRKNFTMYKFRSMCENDASDTAWTGVTDSRITPFGAFIRKFSLDELPQFFNVLEGNMSVIGPRPELPYFVNEYKKTVPLYMVKHQVKPGITGWAQVNGYRGDTSIDERIKYDVWYIENWSVFLDLKIIFMTAFGGMMNEEKNIERLRSKDKKHYTKTE